MSYWSYTLFTINVPILHPPSTPASHYDYAEATTGEALSNNNNNNNISMPP